MARIQLHFIGAAMELKNITHLMLRYREMVRALWNHHLMHLTCYVERDRLEEIYQEACGVILSRLILPHAPEENPGQHACDAHIKRIVVKIPVAVDPYYVWERQADPQRHAVINWVPLKSIEAYDNVSFGFGGFYDFDTRDARELEYLQCLETQEAKPQKVYLARFTHCEFYVNNGK